MSSDDERRIFEANGWTYDHVARHWKAPDGYVVSTDDLMIAADVLGAAVENRIVNIAISHRYPHEHKG